MSSSGQNFDQPKISDLLGENEHLRKQILKLERKVKSQAATHWTNKINETAYKCVVYLEAIVEITSSWGLGNRIVETVGSIITDESLPLFLEKCQIYLYQTEVTSYCKFSISKDQ